MIVRIERLPGILEERLYDLCDGSLETDDPVGQIEDRDVYSAEALLCDLERYDAGETAHIIITGFDSDAVDHMEIPDTLPGRYI